MTWWSEPSCRSRQMPPHHPPAGISVGLDGWAVPSTKGQFSRSAKVPQNPGSLVTVTSHRGCWPTPCSPPTPHAGPQWVSRNPSPSSVPLALQSGLPSAYCRANTVHAQTQPKTRLSPDKAGSDPPGASPRSGAHGLPRGERRARQHPLESLQIYGFIWPDNTPRGPPTSFSNITRQVNLNVSHPQALPGPCSPCRGLQGCGVFPRWLCCSRGCGSDANGGRLGPGAPPRTAVT